jgi:hypothetical protein
MQPTLMTLPSAPKPLLDVVGLLQVISLQWSLYLLITEPSVHSTLLLLVETIYLLLADLHFYQVQQCQSCSKSVTAKQVCTVLVPVYVQSVQTIQSVAIVLL